MKKKKQKPAYMKVRLPAIKRAGGGAHTPAKGGPYDRKQARQETRREIQEG